MQQTARKMLPPFYSEQTVLIPKPHTASQHPNIGELNSLSAADRKQQQIPLEEKWITTQERTPAMRSSYFGEQPYQCDADGVESETLLS